MHHPDEPAADRRRPAAPAGSDVSRPAEQTNAPQRTADRFSVRLLAADDHDQEAALVTVDGEIDLDTAPILRTALLPVLERHSAPVVVDLSTVAFMDSTGVHVLLATRRRLEPQNRRLAIVCRRGGQVHRLLAVVGLLDTLAVHHTRASAMIGGDDLRSTPRGMPVPSTRPSAPSAPAVDPPRQQPSPAGAITADAPRPSTPPA